MVPFATAFFNKFSCAVQTYMKNISSIFFPFLGSKVLPESELHELLNVLILELVLAPDERVEPGGGHERRSDGLDLFNIPARKVLCKDDICCRL